MTLLITVYAAVISSIIWYQSKVARKLDVGFLALMYWGAALMWMVDAIYEYIELRADYFLPAGADMVNDAFLGASVVALGLVIWFVCMFVKNPKGV